VRKEADGERLKAKAEYPDAFTPVILDVTKQGFH